MKMDNKTHKNIAIEYRLKSYDRYGFFLFPVNMKLSVEEKKREEKRYQEQLCELMYMYQTYHNFVQIKQYVLRGSKITCQYGTKPAVLDSLIDHGIYRGTMPVMTCMDCRRWNIHNFGSCMCPESHYMNRLPMTGPVHSNGEGARRAEWNRFPHICVPLINIEEGWYQEDDKLLVQEKSGEVSQILIDNGILVCQYGGIISIEEVEVENAGGDIGETENLLFHLSEEYKEWLIIAEGCNLYPYLDEKDSATAKSRKNVTLGPGITFDVTGRNWDILEENLGWTKDDIESIINGLYDEGKDYSEEQKYAITKEQALMLFEIIAYKEYIPNLNAAIKGYRENSEGDEYFYSQRELEAMFDYSYNSGLSPTSDTDNIYSSDIDNPNKIIYYYLRKDLEGAIAAVTKYGNTDNRRRINQMYLFFVGYEFLDKSGEELQPHREALGF